MKLLKQMLCSKLAPFEFGNHLETYKKPNNVLLNPEDSAECSASIEAGTSNQTLNAQVNRCQKPLKAITRIKMLITCEICLKTVDDPMLQCQHKFCLKCLKNVFAIGKGRLNVGEGYCPICLARVLVDAQSLENIPKSYSCGICHIESVKEQICEHCTQNLCDDCWNEHYEQLKNDILMLADQANNFEKNLKLKLGEFQSRCQSLDELIEKATKAKINSILNEEVKAHVEVENIKKEREITLDIISHRILKLKNEITATKDAENINQPQLMASTYSNLYKETVDLLEQVNYFGETRLTFDSNNFKIEQISEDFEGINSDCNDNDDVNDQCAGNDQLANNFNAANALESVDSMTKFYISKTSIPSLILEKCPSPSGLAIPPWDDTKLYVAGTDSRHIFVIDRYQFKKIVTKIQHPEFSCPVSIAFWNSSEEIFISDKWNNCVHVFSSEWNYIRKISDPHLSKPHGIAISADDNQLFICDAGNNRIVQIDLRSGKKHRTIGHKNSCLNFPTSVAIFNNKIIVGDSGNNRVKIFDLHDNLISEFGSFGQNPGQFRSIECLAVDQLGFILVGDAGNTRIQIFNPDGVPVKILGRQASLKWISGLLVTSNFDLIISDIKTRSVRIL